MYALKGQTDRALQDFDRSIEMNPGHIDALFNRGSIHFRNGDYDKASHDIDQVMRLEQRHAGAIYVRGLLKLKKGGVGSGNADMATAKAIAPHIVEEAARQGIK